MEKQDDIEFISQPLTTPEGYINEACMNELTAHINNGSKTYQRLASNEEWNNKHYLFVNDITSNLAKWAVKQSPYLFPKGLENVIRYLHACLVLKADKAGMMYLSLNEISKMLYEILYEQGVEDFDNWNKSKNPTPAIVFSSRYDNKPNPDDDFIDLDALLHNVCLSFREEWRAFDKFNKEFEEKYGKLSGDEL